MDTIQTRSRKSGNEDGINMVLALYDGAIDFLKRAVESADSENHEEKDLYTLKANEIIVELDNALDTQSGGEVAKNLKLLYSFMNRQLVEAAMENTVEGIANVQKMMTELRESWQYVGSVMDASAA